MPEAQEAVLARELLEVLVSHRGRLLRIAASVLDSPAAAEDVVQDVLLKVCCGRAGRCVECPLSFACRMVRNLAIDHRRRSGLQARRRVDAALAEAVPAPGDPASRYEACSALNAIRLAVAELPPRTQQAFLAHRLEGEPQRDIARALGVSPTLVNFMIRDAHNHCRRRLAERGDDVAAHEHGYRARRQARAAPPAAARPRRRSSGTTPAPSPR